MARTARKKKDKAKQQHLPGMEPPSIPEIDQAAEAYRDLRDERMELTEKESEAQAKLLELMTKHELTTYTYDEKVVAVSDLRKVSVKKKKPEAEPAP